MGHMVKLLLSLPATLVGIVSLVHPCLLNVPAALACLTCPRARSLLPGGERRSSFSIASGHVLDLGKQKSQIFKKAYPAALHRAKKGGSDDLRGWIFEYAVAPANGPENAEYKSGQNATCTRTIYPALDPPIWQFR